MKLFNILCISLQQFGNIIDVEIIFNERGSKVCVSGYTNSFTHVRLELCSCNKI